VLRVHRQVELARRRGILRREGERRLAPRHTVQRAPRRPDMPFGTESVAGPMISTSYA
jgi:hypothetical protein